MIRLALTIFIYFSLLVHSFSQHTIGLFLNDSLSFNGYTLIAPEYSNTYLIDNCGYIVNTWEAEQNPGASTYLLENGNLLRTGQINSNFNEGGSGGRLELYNWDGELIWQYDYSSISHHQHHDVAAMPNGNILLIAWESHTPLNAVNNGRDPNLTSPLGVWSERIVELEPVGTNDANIVWEWNLWDHIIQDFDSTKINFGTVAEHPELVDLNFEANPGGGTSSGHDWIHFNSIDYNPVLDQIVVSSRFFDEFWIIDHSTTTEEAAGHSGGNAGKGGDLIYRWGNPQSYKRGTDDDRKLFGQHDVQWIDQGLPDEGKILIFNNGLFRPGGNHSSIDIIEPPLDTDGNYVLENGNAYGPDNLFWSYTSDPLEDFYSANISGAQRLPNGNTLICSGRSGFVFEITPDNQIVWEYINPVRTNSGPMLQGSNASFLPNFLFRAYRYGTEYPAFEGKDLSPGDPIELDPIAYDCTIFETLTTTESPNLLSNISLIENPASSFLKIKNPSQENIRIEVFDINGRIVENYSTMDVLFEANIQNWLSGFYFVKISKTNKQDSMVTKFVKL